MTYIWKGNPNVLNIKRGNAHFFNPQRVLLSAASGINKTFVHLGVLLTL